MLEDTIKDAADEAGIPLLEFARPVRPAHFEIFQNWILSGGHAGMSYLSRSDSIFKRANPAALMPEVRSIWVFGISYPFVPSQPISSQNDIRGQIAAYARIRDYHTHIPVLLEQLAKTLLKVTGSPFSYRTYTDSAPILERDIAQSAGLGWIGRNSCLINPQYGSFFLLAEMFTSLNLDPTPGFTQDFCGTCRRCIDACPGCCIQENRTIDAQNCISYLTIENKGAIPHGSRPSIGNQVFGCDICQQVCPWNARAALHLPLSGISHTRLPEWIDLHKELHQTNDQFNANYAEYPVMRAKRSRFLRNIAVAIGNARQPESVSHLKEVLDGEPDPLIRAHAAWALGQIGTVKAADILSKFLKNETDVLVQEELSHALSGQPGR